LKIARIKRVEQREVGLPRSELPTSRTGSSSASERDAAHSGGGQNGMRNTLQTVCLVVLARCGGAALGPSAMTGEGFLLSGATRLSYALDIPETGSPPYPMVVFGHDLGPNTKNENKDWTGRLVENGVAVFRFDKRGVGDSDGVYRRGFADFELLSGDLVAAVDFVFTVGEHNFWDEIADDKNLTISQLSAILAEKPRTLDPGCCSVTSGIPPDGVLKEVAGGAGRRKKRPLGK